MITRYDNLMQASDLKRGDLFLVEFKHDTENAMFKRPCVVVSNDIFNKHSQFVNICLLTSKEGKRTYPSHVLLNPSPLNKLRRPSLIMCEQIRTVAQVSLVAKIGELDDADITKLDMALVASLGIQR